MGDMGVLGGTKYTYMLNERLVDQADQFLEFSVFDFGKKQYLGKAGFGKSLLL